jgi:ribosomal protein L32
MKGRTRDDIDKSKAHIIQQLEGGIPKSEICAQFKCKPDTLNRRLKGWGVNHLNNQPGRNRPKYAARKPLVEYLTTHSTVPTYHLKLRLWRDGLKPLYCEECGWAKRAPDGRLPLELHHVNGDTFDNRLENLLVLCPNCHSLKSNHRGLSKGKYKAQAVKEQRSD